MQDLLWENIPTKERRQVFDIGEAKILDILSGREGLLQTFLNWD